jgi:hypothetical protein
VFHDATAVIVVAMLAASPALAHSWYPLACCGNLDCFPVAYSVVLDAFGIHHAELKIGEMVVVSGRNRQLEASHRPAPFYLYA